MNKLLLVFLLLFSSHFIFAQGEAGIDIGQPINPSTGAINFGTDTSVIGPTCTPWVRVNFILGPWSSPNDQTLHNGKTWLQTYNAIIDPLIARGIQVYALVGTEAYTNPGGTLEQYPGNDSALSVAWINGYTVNFVDIVNYFKDRVRVYESFNEPNNWTNSNTSIVHPAWFALMLQNLYLETKYFNSHNIDPAWQVTLVSGALFTFDLNTGGQYINDTYWYGKNIFAWDWTHQQTGSYPLDGFGQHIYVEQGNSNVAAIISAMNNNLNDFWNNIYVYETDPNKKIYISEFGWESGVYGEQFQSDNLTTGFNVLLNDVRVQLSLWFSISDFPGGDWGIYFMGNFQPSDRKIAYYTFKNLMVCPVITSTQSAEENSEIKLMNENGNYFLNCDFSTNEILSVSLYNLAGQTISSVQKQAMIGKTLIPIDVAKLAQGLYLLRLDSKSVNKTFKLKV